ncbi:MAG: RNA pyrophosphohydrolase [Rhodobacteraceae bacterium]|nr:RNA pyrophosphohydrolase [Paracoccaceae bacterium]
MVELPYRPCVGIMMLNAQNDVFVGQRRDGISEAWQMPQGGIDRGEDHLAAALRELEEETGVTSDLVDLIDTTKRWLYYDLPTELIAKLWGGQFRGQKQMWFLFRFKGLDSQVKINTLNPEFSSWKWVNINELVDAIVPFKRHVYEEVIHEFSCHLNASS